MKRKSLLAAVLSKACDEAELSTASHAVRLRSAPRPPIRPYCHWRLQVIYDYWKYKRPNKADLPGYQHIDLRDIPNIESYVWIIDVVHNPMRFRFHRIGAAIVMWAGEDNTGRWFDDVWPAYDPAVFAEVVESRRPSWTRGPSTFRPERYGCEIERIRLPLAHNGKIVDSILALSVFFDRQGCEILSG